MRWMNPVCERLWTAAPLALVLLAACDGGGPDARPRPGPDGAGDAVAPDARGGGDGHGPDTTGAGDGGADGGPDAPPAGACPPQPAEPAIRGAVFRDEEAAATSRHAHPALDTVPGIGEVALKLRDGSGEPLRTRRSCASGAFALGGLAEGTYALELEAPSHQPTTSNVPERFPEAVAEGAVTVVTFGDSIPSYGPQPWFPARLADRLDPLAQVANVNVAEPGSWSEDWLPGETYFEERLEPELDHADVIVFSAGGNDLKGLVDRAQTDPLAAAEELPERVDEVIANLEVIVEAIRERAPRVDLVYVVYPNYAYSTAWNERTDGAGELVAEFIQPELERLRQRMAEQGVLLADMLGAIDEDAIDPLLFDELHLDEQGHRRYARELFEVLGGVRIAPDASIGLDRVFGLRASEAGSGGR